MIVSTALRLIAGTSSYPTYDGESAIAVTSTIVDSLAARRLLRPSGSDIGATLRLEALSILKALYTVPTHILLLRLCHLLGNYWIRQWSNARFFIGSFGEY